MSDWFNVVDNLAKSLEDVSKMASDFDFDEMREEEEAEELEAEEDDEPEVVNEVQDHVLNDEYRAECRCCRTP